MRLLLLQSTSPWKTSLMLPPLQLLRKSTDTIISRGKAQTQNPLFHFISQSKSYHTKYKSSQLHHLNQNRTQDTEHSSPPSVCYIIMQLQRPRSPMSKLS
ncbi:hypothetical protein LINPERPRIM_LOCUS10330 [Linum perenne]